MLAALEYDAAAKKLRVIDQLKLPEAKEWVEVGTCKDAWAVIRSMQVRGAPLIGLVAMLGLVVELHARGGCDAAWLEEQLTYLLTSRPTAVNLRTYAEQVRAAAKAKPDALLETVTAVVEELLVADAAGNKAMGALGASAMKAACKKDKLNVLTICNTGTLATAGFGTALGCVRALHAEQSLEHVYACETRPYLQGARLTAFEIVEDQLPGTLIADSMAAFLMAQQRVDCVVVGCDRVAANGDTANKIGTYALAVACKHHGLPFFVAGHSSTLDPRTPNGAAIPIEERPGSELTHLGTKALAPAGVGVWNPAFDVTPSALIAGIVTERGVLEPTGGVFDIPGFLATGA